MDDFKYTEWRIVRKYLYDVSVSTYSVTGSSGLEGEMESDMVAAVRHRDVPGDLTRSSTCNKTKRVAINHGDAIEWPFFALSKICFVAKFYRAHYFKTSREAEDAKGR